MAELAELLERQAETARAAERMAEEKDPQRLAGMAEDLQRRAHDLERTARSIEATFASDAQGEAVEVVLTPDQRARIVEQTGVGLEKVTLHDTPQKRWSARMPRATPREIEQEAAREAARLRLISETRTQVEKIIRQLEALDIPELADTIRGLRRDPTLGRGKGG